MNRAEYNWQRRRKIINEHIELLMSRVLEAEKLHSNRVIMCSDYMFRHLNNHIRKLKLDVLDFYKKNNLRFEDREKFLQHTKGRAYNFERYGLTGSLTKEERSRIIERDGGLCANCKSDRYKLHVHHIGNPRSKDPSNLITLCASCHRQEDSKKRKNEKVQVPA